MTFILRKPLPEVGGSEVWRGIREEDVTGQDPTERAEEDVATSVAEIEGRIEELADQIGRLIGGGPAADREELRRLMKR